MKRTMKKTIMKIIITWTLIRPFRFFWRWRGLISDDEVGGEVDDEVGGEVDDEVGGEVGDEVYDWFVGFLYGGFWANCGELKNKFYMLRISVSTPFLSCNPFHPAIKFWVG